MKRTGLALALAGLLWGGAAHAQAVLWITAEDLYAAYRLDPEETERRFFQAARVEITGVVQYANASKAPYWIVAFVAPGSVKSFVDARRVPAVTRVKAGDTVTVTCTGFGGLFGIALSGCTLVDRTL
jgi:tRNA_anti-like